MKFETLIFSIGILAINYISFRIIQVLFHKFLELTKGIGSKRLGDYALITGATDGIGKALALQMGFQGYNLILVGRSDEKLINTSNELYAIYKPKGLNTKIKIVQLDFDEQVNISEILETQIGKLDIGLVINNVGIGYQHPMYFEEISEKTILSQINVNLKSTLFVTHWAYKKMVEKQAGMIICIGSGASVLPSNPLNTVYAAMKGGVEAFCRSLQAEAFEKNIIIQCQVPLLIATKLSKIRRPSIAVPSTFTYTKAAMRAISRAFPSLSGTTTCPYWFHRIQIFVLSISPTICAIFLNQRNKQIRKIALKKHKKAISQ